MGRVRDPLGPSHLGCGSEPDTQSLATPAPRQMGEGAGGFGLSLLGHQAAGPQLCPGLQSLTPLYPVLGELEGPKVRAGLLWLWWFTDQEACGARAPAPLKGSPSCFLLCVGTGAGRRPGGGGGACWVG